MRRLSLGMFVAVALAGCPAEDSGDGSGNGDGDVGRDVDRDRGGSDVSESDGDLGDDVSTDDTVTGTDTTAETGVDTGVDTSQDVVSEDTESDVEDWGWEPGPLELRSYDEVCGRWNDDRILDDASGWTEGADECDPGTLSQATIDDAVRYTNLYRWLAGLPDISDSEERNDKAQLCAVIQSQLPQLDHSIAEDAPCYTDDGAEAAGSSNLAFGVPNPADAVDLYMDDSGVPSLGHRRWILYPPYEVGGFGQYDIYSCQWVFDFDGTANPEWISFPTPGTAPMTGPSDWSFSVFALEFGDDVTIEVREVETGEVLAVDAQRLEDGFGPNTMSFVPDGWHFNETYEVRVRGLFDVNEVEVVYRTTPTLCN